MLKKILILIKEITYKLIGKDMAEVKGLIKGTSLEIKSTATVANKNVVTSINNITANETGEVSLKLFETSKKDDLNAVTESEVFWFDSKALGVPQLGIDYVHASGLSIDGGNLSTELVYIPNGDNMKFGIRYNSTITNNPMEWKEWEFFATEKWVKDYVRDNGGTGELDNYYTKNEANEKFLPIVSMNRPQVGGRLDIRAEDKWPGMTFISLETGNKCGLEGTQGNKFTFWSDDKDGNRTYNINTPQSSGTLATQEWTNSLIKSDDTGSVIFDGYNGNTVMSVKRDGTAGIYDIVSQRWLLSLSPNGNSWHTTASNKFQGKDGTSTNTNVELTSPNETRKIGIWAYDDGRTLLSAYDGTSWTNLKVFEAGSGTIATQEWVRSILPERVVEATVTSGVTTMIMSGQGTKGDGYFGLYNSVHLNRLSVEYVGGSLPETYSGTTVTLHQDELCKFRSRDKTRNALQLTELGSTYDMYTTVAGSGIVDFTILIPANTRVTAGGYTVKLKLQGYDQEDNPLRPVNLQITVSVVPLS